MFIFIYFPVNVTVRTEPPELIVSNYGDLVCDLDIDSSYGFDISFTWTGPNGIVSDGSNYMITNQADTSILRIERLNGDRDNNAAYTCLVTAVLGTETLSGNSSLTLFLALPVERMLK